MTLERGEVADAARRVRALLLEPNFADAVVEYVVPIFEDTDALGVLLGTLVGVARGILGKVPGDPADIVDAQLLLLLDGADVHLDTANSTAERLVRDALRRRDEQ